VANHSRVFTAPVLKACNWAVGTFCFAGIGAYEFCLQKRRMEKANMKRAVEIIDRKKGEKEAQMKVLRDERRRAKEEADRKAEEAKKSWRFW
jgi:cytochrome c oxidase assembly protein subunit 20